MIIKLIQVRVAPAQREAFLARQRVWNEAMARQPGFLGTETALDPQDPERVWLFIRFASQAALSAFMAGDHDRLAQETGIAATYRGLEVRILEVVDAAEPADRRG